MTSNSPSSLIVLVELLPFEIDLYFSSSNRLQRNLEESNEQEWREETTVDWPSRSLVSSRVSMDLALFSDKIETYLNSYFSKAFNGKNNSAYATFNSVVLSIMQRRETKQIWRSKSIFTQDNPMLRGLAANSTIAVRFGGAAIFLRDGVSIVPKTTIVQSVELDALADTDRLLLYSLQNSPTTSGFSSVTSLSTAIISNPINTASTDNTSSKSSGINSSLTIGLTVGASALTVFAFLLFFIYRRNVFFPPKARPDDDHKVVVKTNTVDISETENSPSSAAPIIISVKLEPTFDDNISEYTESVYSAPKRNGTRSWSNPPPQDLETIKKLQNDSVFYDIDSYNRFPDDEYSAGTVHNESPPKITISDRFIPRYVESPDDRNNSFTSDDSNDIAKQLSRVGRQRSSGKKIRSFSENIRGRSDSGFESTGLFPDKVVDHDIESSIRKYEALNHDTSGGKDDNSTLSSLASFSYSLEAFGDQSTTVSSQVHK